LPFASIFTKMALRCAVLSSGNLWTAMVMAARSRLLSIAIFLKPCTMASPEMPAASRAFIFFFGWPFSFMNSS